MHDIRWIRENAEAFDAGLARRGLSASASGILALDGESRRLTTELQALQSRRNEASRVIGALKSKGEDAGDLVAEVAGIKDRMTGLEDQLQRVKDDIAAKMEVLPNIPGDDVPDGGDESANVELRVVGEKPSFDFAPRDHVDLGEALDLLDFKAASGLAGSRFVVTKGRAARMERALASLMLDVHTGEFGYTEVSPPLLVRRETVYGTGQLPKFEDDLFCTTDGRWLIPTAEVPVTSLAANAMFAESDLPLRFAAHTACFRSEAGAAGKDTRGMLRQHQFYKVELVSVAHPEASEAELERMTGCAEEILRRLGLHYRVVALSTGDLGFAARKTYDLEVWLPGQGRYREISSCSNCGDFQARRMAARFRPAGGKGTAFVHTLNGSGLAVGRALIAVLENCQRSDGSVAIPEVLRPYMGGVEEIRPTETA